MTSSLKSSLTSSAVTPPAEPIIATAAPVAPLDVCPATSCPNVAQNMLERALFLSLLDEKPPAPGEVLPRYEPQLAESFELSEDGRRLTFVLGDHCWSDGRPVTAEDVEFSWRAYRDVPSPQAWRVEDVEDVEVMRPNEVVFHLAQAYYGHLMHLGELRILPKHRWADRPYAAWHDGPEWFLERLVATGPFTMERFYAEGDGVVLQRNPRSGRPAVAGKVHVRHESDPARQLEAFLTGKTHLLANVEPGTDLPADAVVSEATDNRWRFGGIFWRAASPAGASKAVRRAFAHAVDWPAVVRRVLGEDGEAVDSPLSRSPVAASGLPVPAHAPESVRQLLADDGWERDGDGLWRKDDRELVIRIALPAGNTVRPRLLEAARDAWRAVGIAVEAVAVDPLEFHAKPDGLKVDALMVGITGSSDYDLRTIVGSGGYCNLGGYASPELDRLLKATRQAEVDLAALAAVQRHLAEEQPLGLIYRPRVKFAVRPEVEAAHLYDAGGWNWRPAG